MTLHGKLKTGGRRYLASAVRNGFFHIIGGNTLVRIISFLSSILLYRILSKTQMGLFTLPNNIRNIVLLFNGLSMANAVLRYCTIMDDEREKKAYFGFAVRFGLLFDIVLVAASALLLFALNLNIWPAPGGGLQKLYPITPGEAGLLVSLSLIPFFAFLFDMIQFFLRAERDNRGFSKTSVIFTAAYAVFQVLFVLAMQVYGIVAGQYLAYIVSIAAGLWMLRKKPVFQVTALKLRRSEKKGIVRFSFNVLLSTCFSLIMPYIETFILNYFVLDRALRAEFSGASVPPQSIQFLASAVMVYIFPFFARNYRDGKWLMKNTGRLYLALIAGIGAVVALGMALTPLIIRLFFGGSYYTAQEVMLMRVFWVAFGVNSALKMPTGNILAAVGEVRFNTVNAIVSTVVQTVICWVLIGRYGINGAAWGLLLGYLVSSVFGMIYLFAYCGRMARRHEVVVPEVELDEEDRAS